jgi:Mrp family chromosome partitioning ATPase
MTVLGVTRPCSGRGKTLTAANLAISLAIDAHREVLLIDLDLENPTVHTLFGVESGVGIESCLFDGAKLGDVWFQPSINGLTVLPARGGSGAVSQVLRSSSLKASLEGIKSLCSDAVLVINLPPIADRADAAVFEQLVDCIVLVAEHGVTTETHFRQALSSIDKRKLLGTVLNNVVLLR